MSKTFVCNRCGQRKPMSARVKHRTNNRCQPCENAYQREYRKGGRQRRYQRAYKEALYRLRDDYPVKFKRYVEEEMEND